MSYTVVNGNVYLVDKSGLWIVSTTCGNLPCPKTKLIDANSPNLYIGHLFYRVVDNHSGAFEIYTVQQFGSRGRDLPNIRRYSCTSSNVCSVSTIYTAPSFDWRLGQPVTDSNYLFWTEYYAFGTTEYRLRRMPLSGGEPVDIVDNLGFLDDDELFIENQYLYFRTATRIYRIAVNASAIMRDLAVDTLEVTQGIQNLANDVSLVAYKPTYVRAYGRENTGRGAVDVEAYLYGSHNGEPLPGSPLHSLNGRHALNDASSDRALVSNNWLFQVPENWLNVWTLNVRLVVDPRHNYSDANRSNNELSRDVSFSYKPPACIVFVPVRSHSPYASTHSPNFWPMIDLYKRLWPIYDAWIYEQSSDIAEIEGCWNFIFPSLCYGPYEFDKSHDDHSKALNSLIMRDFWSDDPDKCDDAGAETHYVGMLHPDTVTDGPGWARNNNNVALVNFSDDKPASSTDFNWPIAGATLAHELGHNAGRNHIDCEVTRGDIDNAYPYPPEQLDELGVANHYGFDINTRMAIAPNAAKDFMSYCFPQWTSDYTWKNIFNRLGGAKAVTAGAAQIDLAAATNAVFVTGIVTPTQNTGTLNYAWVYPTAALSTGILKKWQSATAGSVNAATGQSNDHDESVGDNYHVRLLDNSNNVLADSPVTPEESTEQTLEELTAGFVATFPAPDSTVAHVQLLNGDTVLDSRTPGTNQPTLTISKPDGGETISEQL